jgi:hypothetical protein
MIVVVIQERLAALADANPGVLDGREFAQCMHEPARSCTSERWFTSHAGASRSSIYSGDTHRLIPMQQAVLDDLFGSATLNVEGFLDSLGRVAARVTATPGFAEFVGTERTGGTADER